MEESERISNLKRRKAKMITFFLSSVYRFIDNGYSRYGVNHSPRNVIQCACKTMQAIVIMIMDLGCVTILDLLYFFIKMFFSNASSFLLIFSREEDEEYVLPCHPLNFSLFLFIYRKWLKKKCCVQWISFISHSLFKYMCYEDDYMLLHENRIWKYTGRYTSSRFLQT